MMTSNGKKLLIAVVGVVLAIMLGVLYYFVSHTQEHENTLENTLINNAAFEIFSIDDSDIAQILIQNDTGEFVFKRTEETETNSEGKEIKKTVYICEEKSFALLSQTKIKSMLYDYYEFYVKKLITEDMSQKKDFGFTEFSPRVTITDINGTSTTFVLGDQVAVDESYYVMKEGEDKIYLMSGQKAASFLNDFSKYRETTLGTMDSNTLLSFSITDAGERIMGIRYKNKDDQEVITMDTTTYVMTLPYNGNVRIEPFSKLVSKFADVVVTDFIEDMPTDISKYGLDKPLEIVLQDIDMNIHRLKFGNLDEKGNVYTMYNEVDLVFTTTPEMYDAVKNVDPFEYVEKFANIYNIVDVANIMVASEGKSYSLDIKKTGQDEDGEDIFEYKINGQEAIEDGFKSVYQSVIGLVITGEAEEERKETEVCTIDFTFNDGSHKRTVIYDYDERSYGVLKNDGTYNLTLKKNVKNMLGILDEFNKKPSVKP